MPEDQMGDTSVLEALFRHNTWANLKLLEFCAGLSDEQIEAQAVGGYGSILETLVHIVGGEVSYVNRFNGRWPPTAWPDDAYPSIDLLKEGVRWAGDEFTQMALAARAESMVRETNTDEQMAVEYPLSSFLVQAINHATEHRTQISTIITQLGLEPPDMSGWVFMEELGQFREWSTAEGG